jgi:hypothetical protein
MACSATSRCATKETLRAWRSILPAAATPGAVALGLRFPKNIGGAQSSIRSKPANISLLPLAYSTERNRTQQRIFATWQGRWDLVRGIDCLPRFPFRDFDDCAVTRAHNGRSPDQIRVLPCVKLGRDSAPIRSVRLPYRVSRGRRR